MEGPETELKSLTISEIGFLVKSFDELMNSCLINSNDNYLELYLDKELKKLSVLKHNNNDIRSKLLKSKPKIKEKRVNNRMSFEEIYLYLNEDISSSKKGD